MIWIKCISFNYGSFFLISMMFSCAYSVSTYILGVGVVIPLVAKELGVKKINYLPKPERKSINLIKAKIHSYIDNNKKKKLSPARLFYKAVSIERVSLVRLHLGHVIILLVALCCSIRMSLICTCCNCIFNILGKKIMRKSTSLLFIL